MAERSVFISKAVYPYFEEIRVEFDWFGGFALSQKRKCEIGLHKNFLLQYPGNKVLEVSSSSLYSLGTRLSAMNLWKRTKKGITSVESAFQSSKVFGKGDDKTGPFPEYLFLPGKECKKKVKELSKGYHFYEYRFDGMTFTAPAHHISQFYDYLYLNALLEPENEEVREHLLEEGYTAFTDLATKSLNSQARSLAIFVGLVKAGKIDKVKDVHEYQKMFHTRAEGKAFAPVVPCRFSKEDVEKYYLENCGKLTNKKDDMNFLDKVA